MASYLEQPTSLRLTTFVASWFISTYSLSISSLAASAQSSTMVFTRMSVYKNHDYVHVSQDQDSCSSASTQT